MPTFKGISMSLVSQFGVLTIPEFAPLAEQSSTDPFTEKEPEVPLIDKSSSVVSVYVPIYPSSMFWIAYNIPDPDPVTMFYFKFFVNSRLVVSWGCSKREGFKGKTMFAVSEDKKRNGRKIRQTLSFGAGYTARAGGTLTVKVYRARGRRRMDPTEDNFISTNHGNRDTGGKLDKNDTVVLTQGGRLPRSQPLNHYQYALIDPIDAPHATFQYLPRTWERLAQLGVTDELGTSGTSIRYSPSNSSSSHSAQESGVPSKGKEKDFDQPRISRRGSILDALNNTPAAAARAPLSKEPSPVRMPKDELPSPAQSQPPSPVKRSISLLPRSSLYSLKNETAENVSSTTVPARTKRNLTPSPTAIKVVTDSVPHQEDDGPQGQANLKRSDEQKTMTGSPADPRTPEKGRKLGHVNFSRPTPPSSLPVPSHRVSKISNPTMNKPILKAPNHSSIPIPLSPAKQMVKRTMIPKTSTNTNKGSSSPNSTGSPKAPTGSPCFLTKSSLMPNITVTSTDCSSSEKRGEIKRPTRGFSFRRPPDKPKPAFAPSHTRVPSIEKASSGSENSRSGHASGSGIGNMSLPRPRKSSCPRPSLPHLDLSAAKSKHYSRTPVPESPSPAIDGNYRPGRKNTFLSVDAPANPFMLHPELSGSTSLLISPDPFLSATLPPDYHPPSRTHQRCDSRHGSPSPFLSVSPSTTPSITLSPPTIIASSPSTFMTPSPLPSPAPSSSTPRAKTPSIPSASKPKSFFSRLVWGRGTGTPSPNTWRSGRANSSVAGTDHDAGRTPSPSSIPASPLRTPPTMGHMKPSPSPTPKDAVALKNSFASLGSLGSIPSRGTKGKGGSRLREEMSAEGDGREGSEEAWSYIAHVSSEEPEEREEMAVKNVEIPRREGTLRGRMSLRALRASGMGKK